MATESNQKSCSKCAKPLIVNGIHMGIPFAYTFSNPKILVCSKCYDQLTVEELKKDV